MSLKFELGPTSATAVELTLGWSSRFGEKQIKSEHRAKAGNLYRYVWGAYERFSLQAEDIPGSAAALVNSWWGTATPLLLFVTSGGVTATHSVYIVNDETPLRQYVKPSATRLKGTIELEGYL